MPFRCEERNLIAFGRSRLLSLTFYSATLLAQADQRVAGFTSATDSSGEYLCI